MIAALIALGIAAILFAGLWRMERTHRLILDARLSRIGDLRFFAISQCLSIARRNRCRKTAAQIEALQSKGDSNDAKL